MIYKNAAKVICFFLALTVLFPKLLLVHYTINALWGNFDFTELFYVFMQDIMLAIVFYNLLIWAYTRNKQSTLILSFFIGNLLLIFLMLDVRVRELWLVPINFELIKYTINNYRDLMSGADVFLKYYAGLGMTFRRALFALIALFTLLYLILLVLLIKQNATSKNTSKLLASKLISVRSFTSIVLFAMLFLFAVVTKSVIYSTEENVVISPVIKLLKNDISIVGKSEAISFEQPLRRLTGLLSHEDRYGRVEEFKNVIIIILESVRYKEFGNMHVSDSVFHMPFLKKIASEGIFQKCYVSVPHTSKSQFAILSGRNPYPDIEMRESMIGGIPSIVSLLKEVRGSASHFITVQNLNFENTSGMVKALGFEHLYGPDDFAKNNQVVTSSSFGLTDNTLLNYPFEQINKSQPFIVTFMTNGAHYPYNYPNKIHQDATSYKEYLMAEKYVDESVAKLFEKLDMNDLLNDTIVVIVGDHGESFGEHGTYIHNSSMYEEEVTVPLIFWAKDINKLKTVEMKQPARQIDIAPTIAEFFGVIESKSYILQGGSLIRSANQVEANYPIFISTFFGGTSQAIVGNKEKLILNIKDKTITKYDLENDPAELRGTNLVGEYYERNMMRFEQFSNYHNYVFTRLE